MPKAFDIDDFEAELEPIREVTLVGRRQDPA
jgi:hypothetical protein